MVSRPLHGQIFLPARIHKHPLPPFTRESICSTTYCPRHPKAAWGLRGARSARGRAPSVPPGLVPPSRQRVRSLQRWKQAQAERRRQHGGSLGCRWDSPCLFFADARVLLRHSAVGSIRGCVLRVFWDLWWHDGCFFCGRYIARVRFRARRALCAAATLDHGKQTSTTAKEEDSQKKAIVQQGSGPTFKKRSFKKGQK